MRAKHYFAAVAASALLAAGSATPVGAAIVAGDTGTQNTTAVGTVIQFNNVGKVSSGLSGIYLGSGVVLTAFHVGAGEITLGGTTYTPIANSAVRLTDSVTQNPTDLLLYRINGTPALPSLTIASSTPAPGTPVVLAGNGRNREVAETRYVVTGSGTGPYTWTETTSGGNAAGYKWAAGTTLRWGNNTTEDAALVGGSGPTHTVDAGFGDVRSLLTDFDNVSGEGQAAGGDSGGAVFGEDGTLLGLMHAVGPFRDQPGDTSIYGNTTYAADLSYYRSQIVAYVPEPSSTALLLAGACGILARRRVRPA